MVRVCLVVFAMAWLLAPVGVSVQTREPIIDMHLHALAADDQGPPPLAVCTPIEPMPLWSQQRPFAEEFMEMFKKPRCADPVWSPRTDAELMSQTIDVVRRLNITGIIGGPAPKVDEWMTAEPNRFLPGLSLNAGAAAPPPVATIRERHQQDRLRVIAEVTNQYAGVLPDDPRMEPYWQLAEELDIPVGYHLGTGPPGSIYLGFTNNRGRFHSALLLDEVLVKHPRLRLYVMHAGYPMLDDMLTALYHHPQLYLDVGVIVWSQPRPAFYRYLQAIIDAGFGQRVMFGSDQMVWPGVIERSIAVISEAPFLKASQKRDILYNNAARFLRLSKEEIDRHHGK